MFQRYWAVVAGRRTRVVLGGSVAVVLAVVALLVFWPSSGGRTLPPTRARAYTDSKLCLLTPPAGLADRLSQQAWQGLQDASARTGAQVRYLAVTAPESVGTAVPLVNTLVSQGCGAVVATDPVEAQAARTESARYPKVHFLVVGPAPAGASPGGLRFLSASGLRAEVARAVSAA